MSSFFSALFVGVLGFAAGLTDMAGTGHYIGPRVLWCGIGIVAGVAVAVMWKRADTAKV